MRWPRCSTWTIRARPGEWLPNKYGGRENLEAIEFLRELNVMVHEEFPGALTCAEESTAWPMVSRPTYLGGLGFSHEVEHGLDERHAVLHATWIRCSGASTTTSSLSASSTRTRENFLLPLSHDEVVHGKGALLDKMPGDTWQEFANLRLLFTYQYTSPGKKLNFMGNELAQGREWRRASSWTGRCSQSHWHNGVQRMVRDLNRLHRDVPALHEQDFAQDGFAWIDCHDADQSTLSFMRRARDGSLGGGGRSTSRRCRATTIASACLRRARGARSSTATRPTTADPTSATARWTPKPLPWMGLPYSAAITLPPLAGIILEPARG